jgi:uncharacterized membrane protein YfcA
VQQLMVDFAIILPISIGIGVLAAMTGISGGAFKTPILIILFGISAEVAPAASLLSALFVAIVAAADYYRRNPQLIEFRTGTVAMLATIPGSYIGISLKTIVAHAHLLQLAFGIFLFPVAVKMLFAQSRDMEHSNGHKSMLHFSDLSKHRLAMAIISIFLAGVSAGLLGLGGGTIIVPVLCIILQFPILKAAATSMYTMIFTTSAGSIINYAVLTSSVEMTTFLFFGIAMGIGMLIGGPIGTRYASKVNAAWLQRLFGFLLIFPLVKMMTLGQLLLDPSRTHYILATIGDAIIWLLIGIPIWFVSAYRRSTKN